MRVCITETPSQSMLLDMKKKYQNYMEIEFCNDDPCKWHPPTSDAHIVARRFCVIVQTVQYVNGSSYSRG
jgi:hypothetical protein